MMKTTWIQKVRLSGLLGGLLVFATTGIAQEQAPLISELLEEGVYQEEANGDLDAAISLYQQIVESEQVSRPKAAEAQYRLAACYQKQGRTDLAVESFEALVDNYPNQTEWVDAALVHLPKPFEPGPIPWVDGESGIFDIRLPTGAVVGYVFYRTEFIETGGRELWKITNLTMGGMEMITSVTIDPITQAPVHGYFSGDGSPEKAVSWEFDEGRVRSLYGEDPEEKVTQLDGPVIDNLQAQYMVRQFPVEVGFSTERAIFVGMTGMVIPVRFSNLAIEEVETPLGVIECVKTEIDLDVQKQTIWTSTDASRQLVKFQAGGVEIVVSRFEVVESGELQTYRNDALGVEVDLPADWGYFKSGKGENIDRSRIEVRKADDLASYSVTINRKTADESETAPTDAEAARATAENHIKEYERKVEGFVLNEGSWDTAPSAGGERVSFTGELRRHSRDRMVKKSIVKTGDLSIVFTMRCDADESAECEPVFDAIVDSLRVD